MLGGIAQCGDNLVTILTLKKIGGDRSGGRNQVEDHKDGENVRAAGKDRFSGRFHLLTKMIMDSLTKAGYTNVTNFNNEKKHGII